MACSFLHPEIAMPLASSISLGLSLRINVAVYPCVSEPLEWGDDGGTVSRYAPSDALSAIRSTPYVPLTLAHSDDTKDFTPIGILLALAPQMVFAPSPIVRMMSGSDVG